MYFFPFFYSTKIIFFVNFLIDIFNTNTHVERKNGYLNKATRNTPPTMPHVSGGRDLFLSVNKIILSTLTETKPGLIVGRELKLETVKFTCKR